MQNSTFNMNELCDITSSKRIYAADYKSDGIPFYRGKEITEKYRGNLDVSVELFIDPVKFEQIRAKFGVPVAGDLLLTSVGTLGSPYVVKEGEEFYFKDGNLTWFRNFKGLDSRFLYYWLQSPKGKAELKKCIIGSSQSAYTINLLKKMEILLPHISTQRTISAILSTYDDLIENNQKRVKILEEMAQSLYSEWFVHFRYPGHESASLTDSPLGPIPEGWEVSKFSEVVFIDPQTIVARDGEKPFVPMTSLSINSMVINAIQYRDGNSGSKFRKGDTLLARITPCLENGKTAYVYELPLDYDVAFGSTEFIVLRSKKLCPEYVYLSARSEEFRNIAIKSMTGATGRQRVQKECFDKILIACPTLDVIKAFSEIVSPIFNLIHVLNDRRLNLCEARDLLLPKLISGEFEVSDEFMSKEDAA